jgi:opacity protein-like surface antigen
VNTLSPCLAVAHRGPVKSLVAIAVALVGLAVGVPPAAAEWFADLYGGGNVTERSRFSLDGTIDGVAVAGWMSNVKFEKSFTVGGRAGYWFELPKVFGVALDVAHFRPDINPQIVMGKGAIADPGGVLFGVPINVNHAGRVRLPEIDFRVTAVAPLLMVRWPMLVSAGFPHGELQPYVIVGPALYIVALEGFHPDEFQPKTSIGIEGGGGAVWEFTKNVGVFAEYRYTHVRPSLESGDIVFKSHLSTHHLLGGISLRY